MQTFNNYSEIISALQEGKTIYWKSFLYEVKVKPNGDLICKCGDSVSYLSDTDKPLYFTSFADFFIA